MSSHCSLPSTILLPQVVVVQVVGPMQLFACVGDEHFQPSAPVTGLLSRAHVGLQPSPAVVLPSSHCSVPATFPSPHWVAWQAPCAHVQPHSISQPDEQPSPPEVLPSSHCSLPVIFLSPHLTV